MLYHFDAIECADGWGWSQMHSNNQMGGGGSGPLKSQIIGLLHAIAYLQGKCSKCMLLQ